MNIVKEVFEVLYKNVSDKDYYLANFAVRFDLRSIIYPCYKKKIADVLFEEILLDACLLGCSCLQLLTWKSHTAALHFYCRYHGVIVETIDVSHTVFNDVVLRIKIDL